MVHRVGDGRERVSLGISHRWQISQNGMEANSHLWPRNRTSSSRPRFEESGAVFDQRQHERG